MNFKLWPINLYSNESKVRWDYSEADWMGLTGDVMHLIDNNLGRMIYSAIEGEMNNDTKRRDNLV